jgi:DNA-binding transcriptional ArsR family regulator
MNATLIAQAQEQADLCRLFGNPCRLLILWTLAGGELPVNELAAQVGASVQNVSQHLALLKQHNLVLARREGQHIYYRVNESLWQGNYLPMPGFSINHLELNRVPQNGGL